MEIDLIIDSSTQLSYAYIEHRVLEGHNVLLASFDESTLKEQQEKLINLHQEGNVDIFYLDKDYQGLINYLNEKDYQIDTAFLNIDYYLDKIFTRYNEELSEIIQINNTYFSVLLKAILQNMEKNKKGLIINISNIEYYYSKENNELSYAANSFRQSLIYSLDKSYKQDISKDIHLINYLVDKNHYQNTDQTKLIIYLFKKLNTKKNYLVYGFNRFKLFLKLFIKK